NLPTYREFYERRWFAPGDDAHGVGVRLGSEPQHLTPHGLITVEDLPGLSLFVEICEDMWVPIPPSAEAALAGAPWSRTSPAPRSRSAAPRTANSWPAPPPPAPRPRTSTPRPARANPPPTSPGTARPSSTSAATCWGRRSASRRAPAPPSRTST